MKKYPICVYKELAVDPRILLIELKKVSMWNTWNVIHPTNWIGDAAFSIDFSIEGINLPVLEFVIDNKREDALVLYAEFMSKEQLFLEWEMSIKGNELLFNSILLSGSLAESFYIQYGQVLTKSLRAMNRNLMTFLRSKNRVNAMNLNLDIKFLF